MTPEKAIEILRDLLTTDPQFPPDDRREAVRLALAALSFSLWVRACLPPAGEMANWPEEEK